MAVVVDTGPLVGLINPKDPLHERCVDIMRAVFDGRNGTGVVPDAVRIETMNFARSKVGDPDVSRRLLRTMDRLVHVGTDELLLTLATDLHMRERDRRLSLTDCVVIEHTRRMRAKAATLASQWHGLVDVVAL